MKHTASVVSGNFVVFFVGVVVGWNPELYTG
jgi:hypothetical protein